MCKNENGKNSFFVFINKVLPNPCKIYFYMQKQQ